jgi:outer membrane protein TolC
MAWSQGQSSPASTQAQAASGPVVITLDEAIKRAQANEPAYVSAVAAGRSAALDRSIARAGLLPSARVLSQDIYVQPNGILTQGDAGQPNVSLPRFVSADARPWEYIAQGVAEENLSLAGAAALRRADAEAAMAAAEAEIARRGLVGTVTVLFYGSMAADHKLKVAEDAQREAADFTKQTDEREQAREAAHADVVKAQLVEQQRDRDLIDARVAAEKARLELGVLLFADPRTPYLLSARQDAAPLASREDVEQAAAKNNPELKSAVATLAASNADVQAAWGALLPSVALNVTYGIDANQFAVNGPLNPDGTRARNLGYSTSFTVNLPVWDWLANEHKVKQSEIRHDVSKVALTNAQRRLIAQFDETYSEAQAAHDQLDSLDASVATAAESLRLTKLRYTGGEATVLEVVDAQTAYIAAENAREDGRVRYESARAALAALAGTM